MGVMGRLLRAEMYRLVHERQFLFALLVILGLYQFMYMGGSYYALQGFDALTRSMVAVRLGCVLLVAAMFGGSYLAEDFEARTFQSHAVDGATRGQALLARLLVFYAAELLLVLAFPLVYALYCTLANGGWGGGGWGAQGGDPLSFLVYVAAALAAVAACASVSGLAAVLSRSVRTTVACAGGVVAVQWLLTMSGLEVTAPLLWLPLPALDWANSGHLPTACALVVSVAWACVLTTGSLIAVRHSDLI